MLNVFNTLKLLEMLLKLQYLKCENDHDHDLRKIEVVEIRRREAPRVLHVATAL